MGSMVCAQFLHSVLPHGKSTVSCLLICGQGLTLGHKTREKNMRENKQEVPSSRRQGTFVFLHLIGGNGHSRIDHPMVERERNTQAGSLAE